MGKRVLLVEGEDDQHVMWNLFQLRAVPETFSVERPNPNQAVDVGADDETKGGDTVLLDSIRAWLLESELECLGVVVDANDKGPQARWRAIRSRMLSAGYNGIPEKHDPKGTVIEVSLPPGTRRTVRFSVWVMPDNHSGGMLEDFVAGMIRENDEMLPRVDSFLGSIPMGQRRFIAAHRPKARIHTWLAVGKRPGRPMGQAIKAEAHLDANHPSVQPFLDWVQAALVV